MEKVLKYLFIIMAGTIVILGILVLYMFKQNKSIKVQWLTAVENNKAYDAQLNSTGNSNRALKLTVDQLSTSNDSLLQVLDAQRKKLKIKDSQIQSLQYLSSKFSRSDTLVLQDTIFKDPQIYVDTLVSDKWYSLRVGLKYPSTVSVTPEFTSNKSIIISSKRETINPPKKCFILRWFQKKHTVLNIDIIEQNPYVKNEISRYVEIIDK